MNIWIDVLGIWGAISPPLAFAVGQMLSRAYKGEPVPEAPGYPPSDISLRTQQHRYDAEHNPNYRGGYRP